MGNGMQINLLVSVLIVLSTFGIYQKKAPPPKSPQTPVEVWCGGDDVFTRGVCDALEDAFASTANFVPSNGKRPGTLVVRIPTNVNWKESGKRIRVFYTVEFTSVDDKSLVTSKGSCWDDGFAECANQIVKKARVADRKLRSSGRRSGV